MDNKKNKIKNVHTSSFLLFLHQAVKQNNRGETGNKDIMVSSIEQNK